MLLEVEQLCFKEFPDQCAGCPDYFERRQSGETEYALISGFSTFFPAQFTSRVVKECTRFHKRKVEYTK